MFVVGSINEVGPTISSGTRASSPKRFGETAYQALHPVYAAFSAIAGRTGETIATTAETTAGTAVSERPERNGVPS
jgi:hypothetical protein